ncbi:uncharacterized protein EV420DRAFT_471675 [Desarmillaria tabescens]|uniref:F-box domain-containing protein n=1 Tax=Armillaria tabescens TaxID=1929756 RepID=A0AA39KF63_ARMTA|nr:uncharacterized protein EV420DRAFT_471675 [Desarmillaria tabescens]KAK0457663.1 hypothetical protein EV420DRAFT_471675 [Desarmillaria tabescens]
MEFITSFPNWHPCKGCACANHAIPSYRFPVTDADSPIADHPDLGKLTRSNEIPNPSEEKTLQEMISDSGKRIDEVDTQVLELKALRQAFAQSIARIDEELVSLDKERQRLSISIRERQRLLGALRRMPQEVLARIFLHTIVFPFPRVPPSRNSLFCFDWSAFSVSKNPLLSLELVSRRWKNILDAFPNLWSYVNILLDRMHSGSYVRHIGHQLSRSCQSPLSISISHDLSGTHSKMETFPVAVLMALFPFSPRVQTLHLSLPGRHFASMQQLHLFFPSLQKIVLLSSSNTSEVAQYLDFGPLPHLRVFEATDVSNIDALSLPWHQITHFTNVHTQVGHGLSAHRVLDVLKMMSRLSICRLSLDLESLTTEVVEETTLGQLQSLTIDSVYCEGFGFPSVIPFVLNSLTLPALLDLSVTCFVGSTLRDQSATFTSIRQLIERSHSPLTSLYFSNGEIIKDDFIHILSNTPTLQDLRLMNMGGGITDEVLNDLARRVDAESDSMVPVLIPHLHTLHLSGYLAFQMEVYVQMVESRWTCHPCHLKSVNICRFVNRRNLNRREEDAKILALSRLDALRPEGLEVAMSTQRVCL